MSSSHSDKGNNFEILYNNLKSEYDQALQDNDEICKEYESTIELLKDTLNKANIEKEKLQNKNKEKLLDIQNLTKSNDKLKEDIKKIKEEKKLKESKIVFLENDNEHYQSKIRQYEAIVDDLNSQLESTLEENITLQTEFEIYKQMTSEELMRKDEELQDCKSDIINKEKIIQQLNTKKMMLKLEAKMKLAQTSLKKYHRKFSETSLEKEKSANELKITKLKVNSNIFKSTNISQHDKEQFYGKDIYENVPNNLRYQTDKNPNKNSIEEDNNLITPILNNRAILPQKFQEIYRKSMQKKKKKKSEQIKAEKNKNDEKKNRSDEENHHEKKVSEFNFDSYESSSTQPKVNENDGGNEKEHEKEELEQDDCSSFNSEKKIFDDLVICNEKNFSVGSLNLIEPFTDRLKKNNKVKENLKKLLLLTQQRRSNLINKRLNIKQRWEKMGYKIRE